MRHLQLPHSLLLLASTASAGTLFARTQTCSLSGFVACTVAPLPNDFCCPSGSTCNLLSANTTILCCPSGKTCEVIAPITCDVSLQNVSIHPESNIKTTSLDKSLPKCGSQCCPFGYSCNSDGTFCNIDANQHLLSPSPSSLSSSSSTPLSTTKPSTTFLTSTDPASSTSIPLTTTLPLPISSPDSPACACPSFPAGAVVAGFFPGLVLGALLAVATFCFIGARRSRGRGSTFGSITAKVSDPIYRASNNMRTDFLRMPNSPKSANMGGQGEAREQAGGMTRVRSLFRRSGSVRSGVGGSYGMRERNADGANGLPSSPAPKRPPVPPMPPMPDLGDPETPRLQREPSSESINIFADPSTAGSGGFGLGVDRGDRARDSRLTTHTTFTEMMERAELGGLRRGEKFVPQPPGEVPPRLNPSAYHNGSPGRKIT